MTEDILNQKVKNIMIIVELENGNSLVARPSEIGKVDGLVTMKDIQRLMSNDDGSDDMKFMSPFVFALDMKDAAREWIKYWESGPDWCLKSKSLLSIEATKDYFINVFKEFFNLEDEK